MAAKATRKVLMLHGQVAVRAERDDLQQTGERHAAIFSGTLRTHSVCQLGALRKACAKDVEFVFVDAPYLLTPVDMANLNSNLNSSTRDDLGIEESAAVQDPALSPRGWWTVQGNRNVTMGLEESLSTLRDVLAKGRYDGVFGFSQGAAMAVLLAALLERPEVHAPFLIDGQPPHPPLQFCVSVASFRPQSPLCDSILLPSFSTPTLFILGKTDVVVVEERSKRVIDLSTHKRVEYHDGGHFVPSKAPWRKFLRSYIRDPTGDITSPGPSAVSENPSETSTPIQFEGTTAGAT
ncbi:uncharacterized protein FIBRA_06083 [Fibroporia radiculosa]|uniref:Serine hydrolase domain-containing protein n=1 Tax=Fibroporia radiculosa TaxID=599839 RepID=J4IB27_9APHY|nr:uncharacterized protein FIBRA_06083 [Fibroporia radiculosa]CCM03931.1 predicted protein [Fibroporia radiculosa]